MAAITNKLPVMAMSINAVLRTTFTMIKMLVGADQSVADSFLKMVLLFILLLENPLFLKTIVLASLNILNHWHSVVMVEFNFSPYQLP